MKMLKRIKQKLKGRRGESMMEALAACLIIAVSMTMLTQVMLAAVNAMKQARTIQENNDKIMAKYWTIDSATATVNSGPLTLNYNGVSIQVPVKLDKYEAVVTGSDLKGTVYEFSKKD